MCTSQNDRIKIFVCVCVNRVVVVLLYDVISAENWFEDLRMSQGTWGYGAAYAAGIIENKCV